MNFTSRPLIVLALLISFGSAALAGGTADYGVLSVSPTTTATPTPVAGK